MESDQKWRGYGGLREASTVCNAFMIFPFHVWGPNLDASNHIATSFVANLEALFVLKRIIPASSNAAQSIHLNQIAIRADEEYNWDRKI